MNDAQFRKHLEDASRLVASWPEWKRNVLGLSSSPTVSEPRPVVMSVGCEQRNPDYDEHGNGD